MKKYSQVEHSISKKKTKKSLQSQAILTRLLEFDGAKELGGEFMGKRYIEKSPTLIYRIKRRSIDGKSEYLYVGYIQRKNEQFQVVIDESWDAFHRSLQHAVHGDKKHIIGIRKREGGHVNGNSNGTKRFGRKKL